MSAIKAIDYSGLELIEDDEILNGIPVKLIYYRSLIRNELYYLDIIIESDGRLYELDTSPGKEEWEIQGQQILSTFQFLD